MKLPHSATVNNWIPIKRFHVGFHDKYMAELKSIFSKFDPVAKEAVLVFDDMSIKRDLIYNSVFDELTGFVDLGLNAKRSWQHMPRFSWCVD